MYRFANKTTMACFTVALLMAVVAPGMAQITPQCLVSRAQVEEALASGLSADEIADQFAGCKAVNNEIAANSDGGLQSLGERLNIITNTGNVFFEAIEACGYHPQREELNCSIDVRQRFGYAGTPGVGPGSNEWVLFCVDFGGGVLVPINTAGVHVHDEPFGNPGPWSYGAVVQANPALQGLLNQGQTLRGRAILSWTLIPTGCGFVPIWGNQADFLIKLDP